MVEGAQHYGGLLLFMALVTLLAIPIRAGFGKLRLPAAIGFTMLGIVLSIANARLDVLSDPVGEYIEFLASLGIVALLFRVGLESDLDLLRRQLRKAALVWAPNMIVPAALAFALIYFWPGLGLIPALFVGAAASATSIGVAVSAWKDAGILNTPEGALLLDVAELDDLSAVVLLSVLLATAPLIADANADGAVRAAGVTAFAQVAMIAAFSAACYAFARFIEGKLSAAFASLDPKLGPFLFAAGAVFAIAALADLLGFSMAVGALFAGLAFSRDPLERGVAQPFELLLAIFGPFFFVSIGLSVQAEAILPSIFLGTMLFLVATVGKVLGAGVPAALAADARTGLLMGASMVPRAEIYFVIMLHGLSLGHWAVPPFLYSAAVLASIATCLVGPLLVARAIDARAREGRGAP
ncbi:cation:proton antiporter [Salinarimonas rosea]|uniref:cation:proton antiporter n=1 Tax=Salinarimonas rosea TaxID=552063 RepID=UPI000423A22C|nr:cation:proton antiporter [Salinarimonas rosea]